MPLTLDKVVFLDRDGVINVDSPDYIKNWAEFEFISGSLEALESFKSRPERFDLVITDMTMPNMTGLQLSRKLKNIRKDIPIILATGFSDIVTEGKMKMAGVLNLLRTCTRSNQIFTGCIVIISTAVKRSSTRNWKRSIRIWLSQKYRN